MTPQQPEIVGHRGAAAVAPENTVPSFRRGVADGSQWLECDVHLSADGRDVIIHDATLDRTAQPDSPVRTGTVAELTRNQLDRALVGGGEHVPTLSQVLEAAVRDDGTRVPLLVEIKAPEATDRVVRILQEHFPPSAWKEPAAPAVVLSFHEAPLHRTRELAPQIPLMRTTTATSPEWWQSCRDLGVAHVGVRIADARQADVERAAELGARLNLWTARTEEELERALELGCDTLTVDDPAWASALISRRPAV
ncbi:glycerophosphodiester phosphodiesterase [Brachybacterium saurashtrense]|uniref:Glycerophosphodiester phosphodiesterase n=1 Tax=Brachybacterium saurashtrense TaxID=556288 RepID=A0A345YRC5_9MICO|nr:glycerophosphodiester phosphodiesterase [Brachybacterium saurashtrense]AXK46477.1 glycerophosphodiester phosphodiesterase [Brachybacterium saurashtrense]RRR24218.1 glycerophosphodiester phosphodiesterase [Brachybacterium saurashtrense]